ncbi:MAG: aminotransferase DegT, partial [Lysobacterales bacterium]
YGDGGALFTDDDDLAAVVRSIRNHGQGRDRYENVRLGLNSRLDSLQAAILLEKLRIFPDEIEARDRIAARYGTNLPACVRAQKIALGARSVWAQYTVLVENRDSVREYLAARGIPTAVYYPRPNHLQPPYVCARRAPGGLPVTEYLQSRVLSLPMHPYLDEATQDRVLTALNEAVTG